MNPTLKLPIECTEEELKHDLWVLGHSPFLAALKAALADFEQSDEKRRAQGIGISICDMLKASV